MRLVTSDTYKREFEEYEERQVAKLKEEVRTLKRTLTERDQARAEYVSDLIYTHGTKETRLRRENDTLTDELKAYKDNRTSHLALTKLREELHLKEQSLKVVEINHKEIEKRLENERRAIANDKDDQYKKGYADGLADGLRKGAEHTADDRKMLAQIAALSAASHSTDASKEIGEAVAQTIKDVSRQLGDGKSKPTK